MITDDLSPIEIFRQEAAELLDQLEIALLDLVHAPHDAGLIDQAFRALHTIKGSGAMFGFDAVAHFVHDFETAFDKVRKGKTAASAALINVALDAKDHIRQLVHAPEGSAAPARGEGILKALSAITGSAQPVSAASPPAAAPPATQADDARKTWQLDIAFVDSILVNGSNPLLMLDELRTLGDCALEADWQSIPTLDELNAQNLYLTWAGTLKTEQPIAVLDDVFMFVLDEMRLETKLVEPQVATEAKAEPRPEQSAAPLPAATERGADSAKTAPPRAAAAKENSTIRVPAERLDEMMDRVGELVIVQERLSQLAASKDESIKSVAEDIARLTAGLREAMMGIRMVPIGTLFSRFRRLIHDLSHDLGKQIDFVTEGDETELDKTMIERLADPLVHVIRNSADHGLEGPTDRVAAGKTPAGRIRLEARHAGAEVLVSVSDDGRGLNGARIRQKAEEAGLIAPGAVIPDNELYALIFAPGFSTAKEVSALSGRGVGMDVVKRTIEAMRGSIDVVTNPGQGTTITFRLPLTLAIIEGLLVRVAETRYVIPLTAVEECVELSGADSTRSEGRSFLNVRGDLVPFLRLREVFGEDGEPDAYQKVVIVAFNGTRVGLAVDQIIGSHQTVIKSLSKLHADVASFSGATILGDGSVALILDILQIVALGQSQEARLKSNALEMA